MTPPVGTGPLFSIIVPVFDPPERFLRDAIASIRDQTFTDWELILVDDGSREPHVERVLREAASCDDRIRVDRLADNRGIVAASNLALSYATGSFVALLDHDDLLEPTALAVCAAELSGSDVDYLYTDEDRLTPRGAIPSRKPAWSPERLRGQMYTGHLSVFKRSLVEEVGRFRPGFDGSQDYDLVLRVTEKARRIVHVPQVLYHWRWVGESVSQVGRPEVFAAARRALQDHLDRVGIRGRIEQVHPTGVYRVQRQVTGTPLVSIIIPTGGSSGAVGGRSRVFVVEAVRSILKASTYQELEFVIVADEHTPPPVVDELVAMLGERLRLVSYGATFNFSRKINIGATMASGEYLLLLNDDVEVISEDWIETMLGLAQEPDVGLVGAMLYFDDGTIQHAGHVYNSMTPGHIGYGMEADEAGPIFAFGVERECSGVTAACAMIRRSVFYEVGGMSVQFAMNYNDVDLSLKVRSSGRRIIWTPHAKLFHFESKSRTVGIGASEVALIRQRWGRLMELDPYFR